MATLQQVINLARVDLNDDDKTRFSDPKLLLFANNYIHEAIKNRPDLFLGEYLDLPDNDFTLGGTFPMPNTYRRACADYIVGRAMMLNTEESSMTQAANYIGLSAKESGV